MRSTTRRVSVFLCSLLGNRFRKPTISTYQQTFCKGTLVQSVAQRLDVEHWQVSITTWFHFHIKYQSSSLTSERICDSVVSGVNMSSCGCCGCRCQRTTRTNEGVHVYRPMSQYFYYCCLSLLCPHRCSEYPASKVFSRKYSVLGVPGTK